MRPKRRLGQSFLIDARIRDLIVKAAEVGSNDLVVEIGAGTGTLTLALAEAAGGVLALEIDPGLFRILEERLKGIGGFAAIRCGEVGTWVHIGSENVILFCEDALQFDFAAYLQGRKAQVVANLPYSVATPLILRLLSLKGLFSSLLLMLQQEVAQRLLALPGGKEYGALTVACRYQADVTLVAKVPKEAFYPRPKVSSALVRLDPLPEPRLKLRDPSLFFQVVRAAFGKRRKMLRNALLQAPVVSDREALEQAFKISGIDPRRRGETLSIEEFSRLSDAISSCQRSAGSLQPLTDLG